SSLIHRVPDRRRLVKPPRTASVPTLGCSATNTRRRHNMSRQEVLVDADWVTEHAGDENVVFVEVDEDTPAYDGGHIPGAIKLDWKKDLQDPVRRDFVNGEQFSHLLSEGGVAHDNTGVR